MPDVGPDVCASVRPGAVVGADADAVPDVDDIGPLDVAAAAELAVNQNVPETGCPSAEVTRHVTV
jgi:hypothetical protein